MKGVNPILIILCCSGIQVLSAQKHETFMDSYSEFRRTTPMEVLQITTDRDFYLAGETVCFSVRGFSPAAGSFPPISDVINVELIDAQNEIVEQQRLRAMGLFTSGALDLPQECLSGYYIIQVYTGWSRNLGQLIIARKHIRVINISRAGMVSHVNEGSPDSLQPHLTIHPVYGKMLVNQENRIIVKALTRFLEPLTGRGTVYTASGDSLAGFYTDSTGLGFFEIMPIPGAEYSLQFLSSSGDHFDIKLPSPEEGIGISVSVDKEFLVLKMIQTEGYDPDKQSDLIIMRGVDVVYHQEGIQKSLPQRLIVPLPGEPGIYTVFLVTPDLEILAQTGFFVPPVLKNLIIHTSRQDPGTREKVQVYLDHPQRSPGESSYALTVTRDMRLLSRDHLSDWLDLLGGSVIPRIEHMNIPVTDQKGLVELMEKYVHTIPPVLTPDSIAWLMCSPKKLPPEHGGEILSGKIMSVDGGRPVSGQVVLMSFNGESAQMFSTVTDAYGKFAFLLRDVCGDRRITICCYPPDDSKMIIPDNPYAGSMPGESIPPVIMSEQYRKELEDLLLAAQVQQAYQGISPDDEQQPKPVTDGFYGEADFHLVMDQYIELPVMEEVFFELVNKVITSRTREGPELLVLDEHLSRVIGDSPLILVDGVPFVQPAYVLSMPPSDIESIRVVHYRYYLENLSFDGIIDIRTREKVIRNIVLPPGALGLDYHFSRRASVPRFPDHSSEEAGQKRIPDYRNLLFWDPCITKWNDVTFFTSDQKGTYRITVKEFTGGKVTGLGHCLINVK